MAGSTVADIASQPLSTKESDTACIWSVQLLTVTGYSAVPPGGTARPRTAAAKAAAGRLDHANVAEHHPARPRAVETRRDRHLFDIL